jgi:hypothetical protein
MDLVYIYADESCLGNQYKDRDSPGGAGGLVEFWREDGCVRRDWAYAGRVVFRECRYQVGLWRNCGARSAAGIIFS